VRKVYAADYNRRVVARDGVCRKQKKVRLVAGEGSMNHLPDRNTAYDEVRPHTAKTW
jgi:hypothetical protein